ncbi:TIM barrel protein [Carnimonas nigrificans]|uniref:TIM barrel protein n=1 Tax=Carnimonas nigrificans TaxID=64323 RepID=UPI0004B90326|nr:TIM barrel protein [Carnimonas nigrificans]
MSSIAVEAVPDARQAVKESLAPYGLKLAVSPLSWTNDVIEEFGDDTPFDNFMDAAANLGFQGIELGRKVPRDERLKSALASYQLELASGWYSGALAHPDRTPEQELREVESHAQLLAENNARVMVYGECGLLDAARAFDVPLSARGKVSDWRGYGDRLSRFAESLKEHYGLALSFHQHQMMPVETSDELDKLMDATSDAVGLLFDSGHMFASGVELGPTLKRYGKRINHIHLKDIRASINQRIYQNDLTWLQGIREGMYGVPGQGVIDFSPVFDFAKGPDYQGWMVLEAEQNPVLMEPLRVVSEGREFILDFF